MERASPEGPAWVGIGAQRSGTTWFTYLLTRHPDVCLGPQGQKELHYFNRFLVEPWTEEAARAYRALFGGAEGRLPGEFTPFYLRGLWIPPMVREACGEDLVLVVLLRDPVDRFASAMSWFRREAQPPEDPGGLARWTRERGADALWAGMYATHLAAWTAHFPPDRFVVQQYEAAVRDPQAAVSRVWTALGVDPVDMGEVSAPSATATPPPERWTDQWLPALRDALRATYLPEVARLERDWGVDRSLWPSFSD
ncbi:MAG: sulfotransferase family protein [Actinomycetota bacterium]